MKKDIPENNSEINFTNISNFTIFWNSSKDILFQTLDTKISKIFLKDGVNVGLIDTVGFIKNIPTQLIESFKATLEEVNKSDFIINVVDINDIEFKDKITTTIDILRETGVAYQKINKKI